MLYTALRFIVKTWYRFFPLDMVKWWKKTAAAQARLTQAKEGHYIMDIRGEKYPMVGYPRGHLLFGSLSPLKHKIKTLVFNEAWRKLEEGVDRKTVIADVKKTLGQICVLGEESRHSMMPPFRLIPSVREIHRAWTEVEKLHPTYNMKWLKEVLCFILNEDDGYRYRVQFLAQHFPKHDIGYAFDLIEHAEVIDDMRERIRLLKRIVLLVLEDDEIRTLFDAFVKECDWKKVALTEEDKYFFRAKFFRPDYRDPSTMLGRAINEVLY